MPKFKVTKCVDAFAHYSALVEAESADDAVRTAQEQDEILEWEEGGFSVYDDVDWSNIEPELLEEK